MRLARRRSPDISVSGCRLISVNDEMLLVLPDNDSRFCAASFSFCAVADREGSMKCIASLAAAISLAALPCLADTVTIGTVQAYDTGLYTVEPSAVQGFEKALGDELCQRAAVTCEWVVLPPEALVTAVASGKVDAAISGLPVTTEVGGDLTFTMPYLYPDPYGYLGRAGQMHPAGVTQIASVSKLDLTELSASTGVNYKKFENMNDAIAAMLDGTFPSVFAEKEVLDPLIAASNGTLGYVYKDRNVLSGIGMLFRADDVDRRFLFEDQIFEMSQDGSLNALTKTWFGIDAAGW
ncbi:transporter substrate-binding domain-containing protein [Zhengella mangrovi]|nr:transporter substrate-binding domain-containing protein [Zhengella mangrovi]